MDLILGTAGHIDHGKTALVKALTGVDTDRLPEEKRRGITIDLGFAELTLGEHRLGIVDVPGHERFIRNMLAGATGFDVAMLVVAANDSVKPQTREHLQILRLLDLSAGVIALTKCDLPEPEWIELVEQEVRELVAGTFLAAAPIVRTSAATGAGLDALRTALAAAADRVAAAPHRLAGPFRMAIDRAFTVAGHGTVVTGSVSSGLARVGDPLAIGPGGIEVRIRGLENHGRAVAEVHRGQRAAINLAGVHHEQIVRGQELAAPGHLKASRRITAAVELLPGPPIKNRGRVRVHVGAAERLAAISLLGASELRPGTPGIVQFFLDQPIAVVWGQPLVLRRESPPATLGGGRVLEPDALPRRAETPHHAALLSPDAAVRAAAAVALQTWRTWQPADLVRLAGAPTDMQATLVRQGTVVELPVSPTRTVRVHRQTLEDLAVRIEARLRQMHDAAPLLAAFPISQIAEPFSRGVDRELFAAVLAWLRAAGRVEIAERGAALPGRGPRLSARDHQALEEMVETYRQAGFQPPAVEHWKTELGKSAEPLLAIAEADGRLIRVSSEFWLHAEHERRMRELVRERLAQSAGLTVGEIRELLGTSRKYAVPFCEHLDRIGLTRRHGDLRVAGE